MNLNEIKESGLLELYILGQLDEKDIQLVQNAIQEFPSLKEDLYEIEIALQLYANAHAVPAPSNVLENVLKEIKNNGRARNDNKTPSQVEKNPSVWERFQPLASLLGLIGLLIALYFNSNKLEEQKQNYEQVIKECNNEKTEQTKRLSILEGINASGNQIIFAEATEKYPSTKLYFNHNPETQKNYIQVQQLPALADDQSYQLWSLKGDNTPVPLDVFQNETGNIFEVRHVLDTDAYAITIEPKGGQDSPTLENLVAIIKIT